MFSFIYGKPFFQLYNGKHGNDGKNRRHRQLETYVENGNGVAWANDNTEVLAFAKQNKGYTVGIDSLGSQDTIAPAVQKGNTTLLQWLNDEIKVLGEENFFHTDYKATLADVYGDAANPDNLVVEGGKVE